MSAEVTLVEGPAKSGKTDTLITKACELAASGQTPLVLCATHKALRALTRVPMRPAPQTTEQRRAAQEELDERLKGIVFSYNLNLAQIQKLVEANGHQTVFMDEACVRQAKGSPQEQAEALAAALALPVYLSVRKDDAPKPSPL